MKLKFTFLLALVLWLIPSEVDAQCTFVPTGVQAVHTTVPRGGIVVSWNPDWANLGVTQYDVIMELTVTTPHTFDTISAGIQASVFIPYDQLCNGDYNVSVVAICPDGSRGTASGTVTVNILSESACYLGTTICPGVEINANSFSITDNTKMILIPCSLRTYTLKPDLRVVGGSIIGYEVKPIPYSPPYPLTDGDDVSLQGDDKFTGITYLPFRFCFYDNVYDKLLMAPNGYLTFNTRFANQFSPWSMSGYTSNLPLPAMPEETRNAIYGVYEDIDPRIAVATNTGSFKWAIRGEAPCRVFINSYFDIPLFSHNSLRQSYQIVLYEGTNIIDVYVMKRHLPPTWNRGRGIIGVQNADGTNATCAPGRNMLDSWSTINPTTGKNVPEAWRFTPVTQGKNYTMTWTDMNGVVLGTGDSLTVNCETFVRSKIIATLDIMSCSGERATYQDTVVLAFQKDEITSTDVICQTESYTKNGWNLPPQYIPGEFEYFRKKNGAASDLCGCDTVFNLKLTVNPRPNTDTTVIACLNDTVRLNNKFMVGKEGYLLDTLRSHLGCDSIIVMRVKRYPTTSAAVNNIPQICADDASFAINFAQMDTSQSIPSRFRIDFDAAAEAAGFVDFDDVFDNTTFNITFNMPASVYPNRYCADVYFIDTTYNCEGTSFTVCFDVLYPDSILQQKWTNVIAVKNKHYNGGFDISAVQWYQDINGVPTPIAGQNGFVLQTGVTKGVGYRVEVTRPDGTKMMSCPLVVDNGKNQTDVVVKGNNIDIFIKQGGKSVVNLWSIGGILIRRSFHNQSRFNVPAPERDGTYLLEVVTEENGREVTPIVIKRQ